MSIAIHIIDYMFTIDFIYFSFKDLMLGFAAYQGAVCALLITLNFVD